MDQVVPCPEWDETTESRRLQWGEPYEGIYGSVDVAGMLEVLSEEAERLRQEADACEEPDRRGRPRKTKVLQTEKMQRIVDELEKLKEAPDLSIESLQLGVSRETLLFIAPSLVRLWRAAKSKLHGQALAVPDGSEATSPLEGAAEGAPASVAE
jgi:hypothetical protein